MNVTQLNIHTKSGSLPMIVVAHNEQSTMVANDGKLDAVIARRARLEQLAAGRCKGYSSLQVQSEASSRKVLDKATRLNAIKSDILQNSQSPSLHDLMDIYTIQDRAPTIRSAAPPPAPPINPLHELARHPGEDLLAQWRQQRARSSASVQYMAAQPAATPSPARAATRQAAAQASAPMTDAATQTARLSTAETSTSTTLQSLGAPNAGDLVLCAPPWRQWLSDAAVSACAATFAAHVLLHMAGMHRVGRTVADTAVQVQCDEGASTPPPSRHLVDDDVSLLMHQAVQGGLFCEPPPTLERLQPEDVVQYIWEKLAHVAQEPGMEQVLASCVQQAYRQVTCIVPLG